MLDTGLTICSHFELHQTLYLIFYSNTSELFSVDNSIAACS